MNLLITGTFRSSTTLLSRILNSSDSLQVFSDLSCYIRFHDFNFKNKQKIIDEITNRIFERRGYTINNTQLTQLLEKNHNSASELWFDILNSLDNRNSKKFVGEKIVLEWRKIEEFLNENDSNKVIHTLRDPRSVLVSWKKMTNAPFPRYYDSIINCIDSMNFAKSLSQKFDVTKYQTFEYDKFILNPKDYLKKVCSNFSIDYNDKMLNSENWQLDGKKYTSSSMHGKIKSLENAKKRSWQKIITNEEEYVFNSIFPSNLLSYFELSPKREKILFNSHEIKRVLDDKFVRDGIVDWIFLNESKSRFPSDFRDPKTWMKPFYE